MKIGLFEDFPLQLKRLVNHEVARYAYVAHVADGDTLTVLMDRDFYDSSLKRLRVRSVNAAELGTPEGDAARDFLTALLPVGTAINVTTYKQTYDRYEAVITFLHEGVVTDLGQYLIATGHAVPMKHQ